MKGAACSALIALSWTSIAFGQVGTAWLTWQASVDGGDTWTSGQVSAAPGTRVKVRGLVDWSADAGYSLSACSFDAVLRGLSGSGGADQILDSRRPPPLEFVGQTLEASRFGDLIKIDDSRDTQPPGLGTLAIRSSQPAEDFGQPHTNARPLSVFECTLALDSSLGMREFSSLWWTTPTGQQRILLWRSPHAQDLQNTPEAIMVRLRINVVPAPAGMWVVGASAMLLARFRLPISRTCPASRSSPSARA